MEASHGVSAFLWSRTVVPRVSSLWSRTVVPRHPQGGEADCEDLKNPMKDLSR